MCCAIKCVRCGAVSYNESGKTPLTCNACYEKLQNREAKLEVETKRLLTEHEMDRKHIEYVEQINANLAEQNKQLQVEIERLQKRLTVLEEQALKGE